jgi:hypothetical protein
VQVGEQHLVLAHPRVFLGDRLLDLQDQLTGAPDIIGGVEDACTGRDEVGVRDRGADACIALDEHLMAAAYQLMHARGCDGHPELVVLYLARYADLHVNVLQRL